ncbi:MAG: hypothetical protein ACRBFS_04050 [Aureispira sp.]
MSPIPTPYYFVRLQNRSNDSTTTDLSQQHQQFLDWLVSIEQSLIALPTPLQQQYDQQGLSLVWATNTPVLFLLRTIKQLTTSCTIAIDQGIAIYDSNRQWCYSNVPERLSALLQVGIHYDQALVLGEAVSKDLPKEKLGYLTRSYFPGATTALEVYAWKG